MFVAPRRPLSRASPLPAPPTPSATGDQGPGVLARLADAALAAAVLAGTGRAWAAYSYGPEQVKEQPRPVLVAEAGRPGPAGLAVAGFAYGFAPPSTAAVPPGVVAAGPDVPRPPGLGRAYSPLGFAPTARTPANLTVREADRPGPPGAARADRTTAPPPVPDRWLPPAVVGEAARPGAAGAVWVESGTWPMEPPAPTARLARDPERPGAGGSVQALGFAPPEARVPRPTLVVADLSPRQLGGGAALVQSGGLPTHVLPPMADWGRDADRPGSPGWALADATTGPPEPAGPVSRVALEPAFPRPGARAVAIGSIDRAEPAGALVPRAVRAVDAPRPRWFEGWAVGSHAPWDYRAPLFDPVFLSDGPAVFHSWAPPPAFNSDGPASFRAARDKP